MGVMASTKASDDRSPVRWTSFRYRLLRSTSVPSLPGGEVVTSVSTLRFYERDEIEASLNAAGFEVDEVLDVPDHRPGLEWVFVARGP